MSDDGPPHTAFSVDSGPRPPVQRLYESPPSTPPRGQQQTPHTATTPSRPPSPDQGDGNPQGGFALGDFALHCAQPCWQGYTRKPGMGCHEPGSCVKTKQKHRGKARHLLAPLRL